MQPVVSVQGVNGGSRLGWNVLEGRRVCVLKGGRVCVLEDGSVSMLDGERVCICWRVVGCVYAGG